MRDVVITSAVRTPVGAFQGSLSSVKATELGSLVIEHAIKRSNINSEDVNEVIMGNVLPAGLGQAPARQAALGAGLPERTECLTINKVCGSGLKAVMLATQAIQVGDADIVVAGGMESMSNVPYYLPKARDGYRMGNKEAVDGMIHDGLWDVYNDYHMGNAAELCARENNIPREDQDEFAKLSYERAIDAQQNGRFKDEIIPVEVPQRKGEPVVVSEDEEPKRANFEKMPKLRPAFDKDGTVTAANASKINDGAAALVVMAADVAKDLSAPILVRILGQASAAKAPEWFTTAPVDAINKVLEKTGRKKESIDLYEINEAFSVVTLVANRQLDIPLDKINVNGGAVALGHPIGASGARILTTLIYALQQRNLKTGLATLCIGGGEASALVVER
ncbi:MAG: acetyl-CoA C-acetyltransferase [Candidatus Marinimicrobia bacterium]|nr:acetyl-CoA C-acetyltransferase [Candidatus Neomarinimicrobiota bacterium]MCF7829905.1 acetyl-CoA C-acetyltransferase [Candidatus Neomarinimicrobiota bacterium]MCF7879132.1 acetyl-CoA C-acetyltransferase [Candidatus Neomarinimicrobiota bacterium]